MHPLANALIVVNPTVDYAGTGEKAVPHGDLILAHIREFIKEHADEYSTVVAIMDSPDGNFHSNVDGEAFDWWFPTLDFKPDGIERFLRGRNVGHVDIVGLPLETCVKEMSVKCLKSGMDVSILTAMSAGYSRDAANAAIESLLQLGVHVDGWHG